MNFFAQLLQQPPVPDKDNNNNQSDDDDDDEFTVTRGKTLRGFTDDVSEIEIGSEQFNDDSYYEIKKQHKLLSGQQESDKRSKALVNQSKQYSENDRQFDDPRGAYETDNKKKDSKNSKLSLESKLTNMKQQPTAQFINIHRQYSMGSPRQIPSNLGAPSSSQNSRKKIATHMMANLAELKKLKSHMHEFMHEESKKYKRMIESMKINVENEIKRRFVSFANSIEPQESMGMLKSQRGQEVALKSKLREAERLITEYQAQIEQLGQENQDLQEKVFDLEQKVVGIDLEVQEKFQKKRKQLQKKIYQQMGQNMQTNGMTSSQSPNSNNSPADVANNQNNQIVTKLISQNEFLQAKIKSYEKILLEADSIRKMKQSIEQREIMLDRKQNELETKRSQIDSQFKISQKRSIELNGAEESLNKQLNDLKESLKLKEEQLVRWEEQLKRKSWDMNDRDSQEHISPKNSSPSFPQPNVNPYTYNVTFRKPEQNKAASMNFRSPSDEQFSRKIESLNFEKVTNNKIEPDTQRRNNQNEKQRSETERHFKKDENTRTSPDKVVYDPKLHEEYEKFDMQQRQKTTPNHVTGKYNNLDIDRANSHINGASYQSRMSSKADFDGKSKDSSKNRSRLGSFNVSQLTQGKKVSAQFYQPPVKSAFKYEPQYISKPSSTPIHKQSPPSRLPDNYRTNPNTPTLTHHMNRDISPPSIPRSSYLKDKYFPPSHDRSTFSRSSKEHSLSGYSQSKGTRVSYQGYDMNKTKPKFEIGKLNDLGNKIESLKNQLKYQIDSIY